MCCLLEEFSKYKQIRKCNVASFEKEKNQLRKCDVASCKKNATQKMQRWKLHFFAFSVAFVLVPLHLFCIFFFVKKIQTLIKIAKKMQRRKCNVASCKKNATEKIQRWKSHFFCIFRSVIFGICIFRCIFRFSGFATTSLVVLLGVLTAAYVAYRRHSD